MSAGKWIGAAVGFLVGGPAGAAAGFAFGAVADEAGSNSAASGTSDSPPDTKSASPGTDAPSYAGLGGLESPDEQLLRLQEIHGHGEYDYIPGLGGGWDGDESDDDGEVFEDESTDKTYERAHEHGPECPHGIPAIDCNECRDDYF